MTGEAFRKLTVGFLIAVVWLPIEFHFLEAKNTTPVTQKSNANSRNSEHAGYGYSVYNVKEFLVVLSSAYVCQSSRAENATVKARLPCRGYCCECRVGHWSYPSAGRFGPGPLMNNAKNQRVWTPNRFHVYICVIIVLCRISGWKSRLGKLNICAIIGSDVIGFWYAIFGWLGSGSTFDPFPYLMQCGLPNTALLGECGTANWACEVPELVSRTAQKWKAHYVSQPRPTFFTLLKIFSLPTKSVCNKNKHIINKVRRKS